MMRNLVIVTIVVVVVLILLGIAKQIGDSLQAGKRLDQSVAELNQLQTENRTLQEQYNYVQKNAYVETVARNKLDLAKPGETVIVIPQSTISKVVRDSKPSPKPTIANWKGWLYLFIHRSITG